MFKEFAVEPNAITNSYREFAYVVEKFGVPEGRWISRFPKTWARLVYESAQAKHGGTTELKKIEERLRRLREEILLASGRSAPPALAWVDAAVAEHRTRPFHAIVACQSQEDPLVIALDDLDGDHPCMAPNRVWRVARTPAEIAGCCSMLLRASRHIKLVDPHLNLASARFRRPFTALLGAVPEGSTIDLYRGDDLPAAYAVQEFSPRIAALHVRGIRVRLFLRPQAEMHNRFVLTNRGGVAFLTGLDDADGGAKTHDIVTVLDHARWQSEWATYEGEDCIIEWSDPRV